MKTKNSFILLVFSCIIIGLQREPAPSAPMPAKNYYTHQNFELLRKNNQQRHASVIILIDQYNHENPNDKVPGSLTWTLSDMIKQATVPIIVSGSILFNLLTRTDNAFKAGKAENDSFLSHKLSDKDWELFDVPGSQFLVLIPKSFMQLDPQYPGLRLQNLPRISHFLPPPHHYYLYLIDWISKNKSKTPFKTADLEMIFERKTEQVSSKIWDIVVNGHGTNLYPYMITGLSIEQINQMLNFFDRYINTGVVDLETCSGGGMNLSLLEFDASGISRNHNYILIIAAVTDSTTYYASAGSRTAYSDFYNYAAQVQDKGESLENLLKSMYVFNWGIRNIHGAENIPQVWLPHGIGFQTFNLSEKVFVLGNVLAKAHTNENRPIVIRNAVAVLVYPNVIKVPLQVYKTEIERDISYQKEKLWKKLPMITEAPLKNLITKVTRERLYNQGIVVPALEQQDPYLYPQFIGMNKRNSDHHFSEINLPDRSLSYIGVMRFLRDSLLDIAARGSSKTFFIDKLIGNNDLSSLLAVSRLVKNQDILHPLERLLISAQQAPVILERITVSSRYDSMDQKEYFTMNFCIGTTAWQLNQTDVEHAFWNFRSIDFQPYEKKYQSDVARILPEQIPQQLPLGQILKEKAQIIAQEKLEFQKKQAQLIKDVVFVNETNKPLQLRVRALQAGGPIVYFNDIVLPGKSILIKPIAWPLEMRAWDASKGVGNFIVVPLIMKESDKTESVTVKKKDLVGARSNNIRLIELPDKRIKLNFDR